VLSERVERFRTVARLDDCDIWAELCDQKSQNDAHFGVIVDQQDMPCGGHTGPPSETRAQTRRSGFHRRSGHGAGVRRRSLATPTLGRRASLRHGSVDGCEICSLLRMLCWPVRQSCVNTTRGHRRLREKVGSHTDRMAPSSGSAWPASARVAGRDVAQPYATRRPSASSAHPCCDAPIPGSSNTRFGPLPCNTLPCDALRTVPQYR
jgi:hypothetical protein